MSKEEAINVLINGCDKNKISDGYHTFEELYEHRIELFIALCKMLNRLPGDYIAPFDSMVWRSRAHSDGAVLDGWFVLGVGEQHRTQITYHLPILKWDQCSFAKTLPIAPDFDGHSPSDVLQRLKRL